MDAAQSFADCVMSGLDAGQCEADAADQLAGCETECFACDDCHAAAQQAADACLGDPAADPALCDEELQIASEACDVDVCGLEPEPDDDCHLCYVDVDSAMEACYNDATADPYTCDLEAQLGWSECETTVCGGGGDCGSSCELERVMSTLDCLGSGQDPALCEEQGWDAWSQCDADCSAACADDCATGAAAHHAECLATGEDPAWCDAQQAVDLGSCWCGPVGCDETCELDASHARLDCLTEGGTDCEDVYTAMLEDCTLACGACETCQVDADSTLNSCYGDATQDPYLCDIQWQLAWQLCDTETCGYGGG